MWKPKEFYTWPSERKKSWKAITRDPNQYYMKYLPPGEEAHVGAWSGMERRRFIICVKVRLLARARCRAVVGLYPRVEFVACHTHGAPGHIPALVRGHACVCVRACRPTLPARRGACSP